MYIHLYAPCGHAKWVCRLDLARMLLAAPLKGRSKGRPGLHGGVKTSTNIPRAEIWVWSQEQMAVFQGGLPLEHTAK